MANYFKEELHRGEGPCESATQAAPQAEMRRETTGDDATQRPACVPGVSKVDPPRWESEITEKVCGPRLRLAPGTRVECVRIGTDAVLWSGVVDHTHPKNGKIRVVRDSGHHTDCTARGNVMGHVGWSQPHRIRVAS